MIFTIVCYSRSFICVGYERKRFQKRLGTKLVLSDGPNHWPMHQANGRSIHLVIGEQRLKVSRAVRRHLATSSTTPTPLLLQNLLALLDRVNIKAFVPCSTRGSREWSRKSTQVGAIVHPSRRVGSSVENKRASLQS
eukprot:SAG11_NODE_10483_length_828_cov_1.467764_1_plen_137_part_00